MIRGTPRAPRSCPRSDEPQAWLRRYSPSVGSIRFACFWKRGGGGQKQLSYDRWEAQNPQSAYAFKSFGNVFVFFGPFLSSPRAQNGPQLYLRNIALWAQSIARIGPMATRLVAKTRDGKILVLATSLPVVRWRWSNFHARPLGQLPGRSGEAPQELPEKFPWAAPKIGSSKRGG